ncbi:GNAT family N-acetyltransferase [Asticcacaulis excentricus]|uniref:GCN5-related N-acetyltransferase n=1 Tax=Asticcacaulis excentricus (strain ATCC 15261 / DSM 4724 / KCTC 12464 / NCIMB 9791 / VKM B-1370 / CB 48) TaxID=573065 RepID=E8RPX8_ASTEC|nr:GNAT family N-acetyltransferase [Asticcacaulis excentricus]ADU13151.1 GCN5-related N-acetyltransferase [Asticcacaulis excentricus CB 48]
MARRLRLTHFRDLSIDNPFFDSLKAGYNGFDRWFESKRDEELYVVDDEAELSGMIYLKTEEGPVTDVTPPLSAGVWLKVGTLKIVGRGTRLGERVIKKIFDTALARGAAGVYVTVFEVHEDLIALFERYGFVRHGIKRTGDGEELVLARSLVDFTGDRLLDYPFVHTAGRRSWLLAIYPEYHTELLPDSILNNEPEALVRDVSHTNTIHKVYISGLALQRMSPGDVVVFYRTTDGKGPAYFRSVVTSICVVEEVRRKNDFPNVDAFLAYTTPRSVFSEERLRNLYERPRLSVAKMTYNVALGRRTTRGQLIDAGVVSVQPRWDMRELSLHQLNQIVAMGEVNARVIVD